MKIHELLQESTQSEPKPKIRNFVAKNAKSTTSGAGAHKDRKKAMKSGEVKHKKDMFNEKLQMKDSDLIETATTGATSAASIGTIPNPHISPGSARGKKSYIGSPGKSGTKSPPQPKITQRKNSDGTARNALDIDDSLFGSNTIKRGK